MRWSKIASIICGSPEETVLGTRAELGSLFGIRTHISNEEERSFVVESFFKAIPEYLSIKANQLKVSQEEVLYYFPSFEDFISGVLVEYFIELKKNTIFVQTFNRVLTYYYLYDGSPDRLNDSMTLFCRDLNSFMNSGK